jgi:hypothetical protein
MKYRKANTIQFGDDSVLRVPRQRRLSKQTQKIQF